MNNLFNAVDEIFETLLQRYPILEASRADIWKAFELLKTTYENDKILFVAGNGGSAADSEHIVGELMKSFMAKRKIDDEFSQSLCDMFQETGEQLASSLEKGLPAVSLPSLTALSTAIINDVDGKMIFAQTLNSIGRKDDLRNKHFRKFKKHCICNDGCKSKRITHSGTYRGKHLQIR